jgi:hypothetical protein
MAFAMPAPTEVLGAMITPALLISASGTLVLSTSNRLGRIVDRVRKLIAEAAAVPPADDAPAGEAAARRAVITASLEQQFRRVRLLQLALTILYGAIGLFVGASLSTGLTTVARHEFGWLAVALGLAGAVALFVASVILVREARLAVLSTAWEIEQARRQMSGRPAGGPAELLSE